MPNVVVPVEANNSSHFSEGGNPVYFCFYGYKVSMDSRFHEHDGDGIYTKYEYY